MKVENTIQIYEVDGKDISQKVITADHPTHSPTLQVESHWNLCRMVVLSFEGKSITVLAKDLQMAITNATNH